MKIRSGYYGFLEDNLLVIVSSTDKWEFTSNDRYLIDKYKFIYNGWSYRLNIEENIGIRAYSVRTYCLYKNGKYTISNIFENMTILSPDLETKRLLGLHIYDDRRIHVEYEEFIRDVSEIWEERKPIEGFIFDVEPIHYIKKRIE